MNRNNGKSIFMLLALLFSFAGGLFSLAIAETTLVVYSTADSGFGTLRQALLDAQNGDTIAFNTAVFPPTTPATINLANVLPEITVGNLTIDASNAGVAIDGSLLVGPGLKILSDGNTVQGLWISNFSDAGIVLSGTSKHNTVGGDRSIGGGPSGQGNQITGNDFGIGIWGNGSRAASLNVVTGNLIGIDVMGQSGLGNKNAGIYIAEGANNNMIGPQNIIANNDGNGIKVLNSTTRFNTITRNSIYNNAGKGIELLDGGNAELASPVILEFNLEVGTVSGISCPNYTIEIFSDSGDEGEYYEGEATANTRGGFTFNKGTSFTQPHLTATATDTNGNTSEFSTPNLGSKGCKKTLPWLPLLLFDD